MVDAIVTLTNGSEAVEVEVLGRAHPGGLAVFDHNWLLGRVAVSGGGRSFRFDAFLRTVDFADFRAELEELAAGRSARARYWPTAPWVGLRVFAAEGGGYRCEVYARDGGSERAAGFELDLDDAGLQRLTEEIGVVVSVFPVVR